MSINQYTRQIRSSNQLSCFKDLRPCKPRGIRQHSSTVPYTADAPVPAVPDVWTPILFFIRLLIRHLLQFFHLESPFGHITVTSTRRILNALLNSSLVFLWFLFDFPVSNRMFKDSCCVGIQRTRQQSTFRDLKQLLISGICLNGNYDHVRRLQSHK